MAWKRVVMVWKVEKNLVGAQLRTDDQRTVPRANLKTVNVQRKLRPLFSPLTTLVPSRVLTVIGTALLFLYHTFIA